MAVAQKRQQLLRTRDVATDSPRTPCPRVPRCLKAAEIVDLLHPLGESAQVAPPTIRDTRDDELLARGDLDREGASQEAHHHGGGARGSRAVAPLADAHTYIKEPMHSVGPMQMTARAFCKKRAIRPAAGLGVMLVGKGGVADEAGGDSPSSSGFLQLVRVPERERCAGAAAATCVGGRTSGPRGRPRRVGLLRLDSGQPMVREVGVDLSRH